MPDEMGDYQNLQDIGSITKVETVGEEALQQPQQQRLPPGFRFHPTDEELVSYYLTNKVQNNSSNFQAIDEVNLNRCEPWDLPPKTKVAENQWYFFSHRDRKYPTGLRTNRATDAGYWKATGKDREVMSSGSPTNKVIGMKKTLVFYMGRAPKGEKTNWIMHEYRIEGASSPVTEWVVCRVFKKNVPSAAACKKSNSAAQEGHDYHHHNQGASSSSYQQELEESEIQSSTYLPPLMDSPNHHQSGGHILNSGGHYYTSSSTPNSAEYQHHQQQQQLQQQSQVGVNFACADIYLQNAIRGHELAELQNSSRSFNISSHLSSSFNPNWAIRREMQGVANAESVDSLVSGFLHDHWSDPGTMPELASSFRIWEACDGGKLIRSLRQEMHDHAHVSQLRHELHLEMAVGGATLQPAYIVRRGSINMYRPREGKEQRKGGPAWIYLHANCTGGGGDQHRVLQRAAPAPASIHHKTGSELQSGVETDWDHVWEYSFSGKHLQSVHATRLDLRAHSDVDQSDGSWL
ncbi:hypothetical protein R1sor_010517 [Riccia sorocarpa]|uniref:NAC domain-containing protein n=1 Tax=Riccia sorocarpa TaxID=122646 RepID=A0ABD3HZQ0_9MARC